MKKVNNKIKVEKKLSKNQKKKLQNILERRKKKSNINKLLTELKKHQLSDEQYSLLPPKFGSISKSLKRSSSINNQNLSASKIYSSGKKQKINHEQSLNKSFDVIDFDLSSEDEEDVENDEKSEQFNEEKDEKLNELNNYSVKINDDDKNNENHKNEKKFNSKIQIENENLSNKNNLLEKPNNEKEVSNNSGNLIKKKKKKKNFKEEEANNNLIDSHFVPVFRSEDLIELRNKLPIIREEFNLIDNIKSNNVVVVCGETGSGKTTQLPQFLYEHGFTRNKKIVITQPRRVAAIAMSKRVAYEMNLSEDVVSYQIRHEGNCTENTKIKFVTDGVLMKELQKDFLLSEYSVVIIDEAHERSIYSDILIGLISRIIKMREKNDFLRMVIMSATLRISDFTENLKLFPIPPPIIQIESRQFPVQLHFSKTTPSDYMNEAYKKVIKIHKEYPLNGGILVFVTGRKEVEVLIEKLRSTFPNKYTNDKVEINNSIVQFKKNKRKSLTKTKVLLSDLMPKINFDTISKSNQFNENLSEPESENEELNKDATLNEEVQNSSPLFCLPLYSMLSEFDQKKVFQSPPENSRLCIVATNVAETSLTIPNIKYVVDTGKIKNKYFDKTTGISTHLVEWCAKSSANQRSGRSGRTGPGHCFRLYSSAVFNDFKDFPEPEILKKPLDDLILQLKSMYIDKIKNFPFPTPPDLKNIDATEKRLTILGALEDKVMNNQKDSVSIITSLGKIISIFPVSPRYGKILAISLQQDLIDYTIAIVACLAVQEIFIYPQKMKKASSNNLEEDKEDEVVINDDIWTKLYLSRKKWIGTGQSFYLGDIMLMLKACCTSELNKNSFTFCKDNNLRHKALVEIHKLRKQLTKEVKDNFENVDLNLNLITNFPNDEKLKKLRQLMLICFSDHIARKINNQDLSENNKNRKFKNAYKSIELDDPVFMNDKCILKDHLPEWVVYQEVYENKKLYMRNVVAIEEEWIPIYVSNLCKYSKPLENPEPFYDEQTDQIKCFVTSVFGPFSWKLPKSCIEYPEISEKYKMFAQFFLEGKIYKQLNKFSIDYLSSPKVILKTWSKLHERTTILMEPIYKHKLCNKSGLKSIFKSKPNFLLKEYLEWLPQSKHDEVRSIWPPSS